MRADRAVQRGHSPAAGDQRQEISDLRRAWVGAPANAVASRRATYPWDLFDACGGDFYLTVWAAVQQHILKQQRSREPVAA